MTGLILGGAFASGILLILQVGIPRRISLADSIAPYVGASPKYRANLFERASELIRRQLMGDPVAPWGTDASITKWLRQSDKNMSLAAFRRSQLITSGFALIGAIAWILLRQLSGKGIGAIGALIVVTLAFVLGGWFGQWQLNESAKKRINLMERQLPSILDLLAFAVAAGEPVLLAMRRISDSCCGPLVDELQKMVYSVNSGEGLVTALNQLQNDLGSAAVTRATHALSLALERGTPLAQVLRAQATDARAHEVRLLLVLAGKKETAMMLPVVFLILPMIVAVALYPGLIALQVL